MKYQLTLILVLLSAGMFACQTIPASEPTAAVSTQVSIISTATVQPTASLTNTPTTTTTLTPTITPTHTPRPSITPVPPTKTPYPTPLPTSTIDPTVQTIAATVEAAPAERYFRIDPYKPEQYAPFPADADLDYFYRPTELAQDLILAEEDVNQDGQLDLIAYSHRIVAIFLHLGEGYEQPFVFAAYDTGYGSAVRYTLKDWTNDGAAELEINYQHSYHIGTGVGSETWDKTIIQCRNFTCRLIWSYTPLYLVYNYNEGGLYFFSQEKDTESDNNPQNVNLIKESFDIFPYEYDMNTLEAEVFTTTETIYSWNGDIFTPTHTTILSAATPIQQQSILSATLNSSPTASIQWDANYWLDQANDVCQVYLQGAPQSEKFGCKHNYTTMIWRDLVDDQTPELVVATLSAQSPIDEEGEPLGEDIPCLHQRVLIYHLESDSKLGEIANVAGCVRQGDLFGVRLEDYDQDGVIDIVTADKELLTTIDCIAPETSYADNCWQELNTDLLIYRWNGTAFTFSERITPPTEHP